MRKNVTSRFKRGSLFDKRIVITIPRGAAVLLVFATGAAMVIPPILGQFMTALGLILSIVAIITVAEARHQLRAFKYELQERITAGYIEDLEPEFKGVEDAQARRIRIPG